MAGKPKTDPTLQALIDSGLTRKQALVSMRKMDAEQDRVIVDPKTGKVTPAPVGPIL